jgi:hypothetical protein
LIFWVTSANATIIATPHVRELFARGTAIGEGKRKFKGVLVLKT